MEKNQKFIDSLKSLKFPVSLPVLTGILICLGFIKGYIFYYVFGIDIRHFFSATDMIKFVSSDLMILIITLFALFLNMFANRYLTDLNNTDKLFEIQLLKEDKTIQQIRLFFKNLDPKSENQKSIFRVTLIILFGISILITIKLVHSFEERFIIIVTVIIIFINAISTTIEFPSESYFQFRMFILSSALLLFFQIGMTEIKYVKKGKYNGTYVKTKEKEYISTDSLLFINKSDDYTFFYNTKFKYTEVIPNSEILLFRIKTNDVKIN